MRPRTTRTGSVRLPHRPCRAPRPPAGPEWRRGALLDEPPLKFERNLCVALDGSTRPRGHARGRTGPRGARGTPQVHPASRRCEERVTRRPDGLVRAALKKPFSDGTSPSTWIRSRFFAGLQRRSPRLGSTPRVTPACSPRRARSAHASRRRPPGPRRRRPTRLRPRPSRCRNRFRTGRTSGSSREHALA